MIDDAAQTWIELPPPPTAPSDAARAAAAAIAASQRGEVVSLVGTPGSGRRTAALLAAAALRGDAYLIPALPWRAPGAMGEIARRLGLSPPHELSTGTLLQLARGAMDGKHGTLILDARVHADAKLIGALTAPGWKTIVLVPADEVATASFGTRIDLPHPPPRAATPAGDDTTLLAAAAFFDPWEGAPLPLLSAVAGLDDDTAAAAVARLMAAGSLRPARDHRRVLPNLYAHQERSEPTDPTNRPLAERFVTAMAAWCARTAGDVRRQLADDRANLMSSLAIWQAVAPITMVDGFAHALPFLLDDVGCHEAAKLVIQATRFGGEEAHAAGRRANQRMGWSA